MNIDYIGIGTELLNGKINDLNGHFLAESLNKKSLSLRKIQLISDNKNELFQALKESLNQSDLIILSGGLGPTKDDITKTILADYFQLDTQENKEDLEFVTQIFANHKRQYDSQKFHYHLVPKGIKLINNHVGYAPALKYTHNNKTIYALPGVPSEFQHILDQEILSNLRNNTKIKFSKNLVYKTWQIHESKIFNELDPTLWSKLSHFGDVTSLPHTWGVDIGIRIQDPSFENKVNKIIQDSPINKHLYHTGAESLEEIIIQKASQKKLTFGFTESCTGGLLASRITDISGSSAVFFGSIIAYDNSIKKNILNVSSQTLKDHGAVSTQTAFEMSKGAFEKLNTDIIISTTGIAGPTGATKDKPVGTIGIGVYSQQNQTSKLYYFKGNRTSLKKKFSDYALYLLLQEIMTFET